MVSSVMSVTIRRGWHEMKSRNASVFIKSPKPQEAPFVVHYWKGMGSIIRGRLLCAGTSLEPLLMESDSANLVLLLLLFFLVPTGKFKF